MPLASLTLPPFEGAVSRTLSDWNRAPLRLSWSRSLYRPFSSFSLVASPSSYIPHPRLAVSCFHVAQLPLRLCLSRPSRSPSLDPSLSLRQSLSFLHLILLPRFSPLTCPAFISPSPRLARSPVTRGETPSLLLIDPRFLLLIHT